MENNQQFMKDTQRDKCIRLLDISKEFFPGIRSFSKAEAEAHTRVLDKLSVDTGINVLNAFTNHTDDSES